jgi:AAA domain
MTKVVIRPGWVWGTADDPSTVSFVQAVRAGQMRLIDGGRHRIVATHIDNLTHAVGLAIDHGSGGCGYYVFDDGSATVRDFLAGLLQAHGLTLPEASIPGPAAAGLARALDYPDRPLSRLSTLTGAGGCGKTRLSLQLAAELLDGSGNGVWLVELAAVSDEDAVAPAICQALGITGQPGRAALEALLDALAQQHVLIVLDNCEHLIGACAKTADAIVRHCPKVRLLATSREPLGIGGETIYRLPPLSLPGPGDTGSAAESSDAVAGPKPGPTWSCSGRRWSVPPSPPVSLTSRPR